MKHEDIISHRLQLQQISQTAFDEPADLVRWLGAVHAQDYRCNQWKSSWYMEAYNKK